MNFQFVMASAPQLPCRIVFTFSCFICFLQWFLWYLLSLSCSLHKYFSLSFLKWFHIFLHWVLWVSFHILLLSEYHPLLPECYPLLSCYLNSISVHILCSFGTVIASLCLLAYFTFFSRLCSLVCGTISFSFFFWLCRTPCVILVPWPGIEPGATAVKVQSPNHWITSIPCGNILFGEFSLSVEKLHCSFSPFSLWFLCVETDGMPFWLLVFEWAWF